MQQDTMHLPTPQQVSGPQQPEVGSREDTVLEGAHRVLNTDSSRSMASMGASRISRKEGCQHKYYHSMPLHQLGEWPRSQFPSPQLPRGYREDQQQEQLLERANGPIRSEGEYSPTVLRDRERRERSKLQRNEYTTRNRRFGREAIRDGNAETTGERQRDSEPVRPKKGERTRNHGGFGNREIDRRCATPDSENRRRLRIFPSDGTEEREGEREESLESFWDCYRAPNWERPEVELENSYCTYSRRRRKYTDAVWPQDARSEGEYSDWITKGATSGETGEQAERVDEDWGRQTSEPWCKSSMEKSPIFNLTFEEKTQTRVSRDDRDDEQLFIPLGKGIEGRSGESHTGVGGEVVQPDILGDKEERKVEEDLGLQKA
ncbi:uncharacterized protein MONOS_2362 [Monocercomonoides exilis]|uniref:uncharacterized protein n=1 Tax=Monocercomonoides exilis TaxID=2049356 RepID=UPI0035598819|nr:hypothetical protein MONOS_2362 [Monocercomonoides exilis]|eukprot:MONOS_2362.1-p1 / transcript=MONOS_2362.1 / gene=MONOS_2362 / organism=Monocercomonoides_exilis_PA203 / gene_product=unspecified product / transcript_product=unspecified product / location=Mono_scaffold00048:95365-96492(-) / protein_length=376 / sequence_SO=supercontig / SO=protein_coding / is_pseudo=false